MDIVEQGRYCQSCQKKVTDFTKLTNQQIIEALSLSGNTCGRFAIGQLENVNAGLMPQRTSSFSWTRFSIAAFFIGCVPFIKVHAQAKTPVHAASVRNKKDTLSVQNAKFESKEEVAQLKKDLSNMPSVVDKPIELTSVIGGVYVQSVEVNETKERSTLDLIRQLFKF
ncbi:hypothetical protein [Mucilaginibacter sp. PPCGB 2223]|uniref:hypothetical protein n=1 Tax=Mucilaginibacter sp. PPCGB 2223 TaxID=1886027 RepID=UPI001111D26B|nr:hypothetical protein [Mucilaginibacter sp. PPCGB 2223]